MLMIKRKPEQEILIGDDIVVKVFGSHSVKIGIEAPKNVRILRGEVVDRDDGESGKEAA